MVARRQRRGLYNGLQTNDVRRISSRSNPLVTRCREVARGRGPDGVILLDGDHLVEEALVSGITLDMVAFADSVVDIHLTASSIGSCAREPTSSACRRR